MFFNEFDTELKVNDFLLKCVDCGAGEFIINSVEKDGTMDGFDIEMIFAAPRNVRR